LTPISFLDAVSDIFFIRFLLIV